MGAFLAFVPLIAAGRLPFFTAAICWAVLMLGILAMQVAALMGLLAEGVPPEEWGRRMWSRAAPSWSLLRQDWRNGPFR